MSYEILSDDLFDDSSSSLDEKKDKPKKKKSFNFQGGIYIHIIIFLLIAIPLFIYFSADFENLFNSSEQNKKIDLTLVGKIENFSISYSGNLTIDSSNSFIKSEFSEYKLSTSQIKIINFRGKIFEKNNSLYLLGIASNISFDENKLILNDKNFEMILKDKVSFNLFLKELNLNFIDGKLVLDDILNYNFDNSSIILNNFNTTLSYDGLFSFQGVCDKFKLSSLNGNLNIDFKNLNITK